MIKKIKARGKRIKIRIKDQFLMAKAKVNS
jgi:hypothetical protein